MVNDTDIIKPSRESISKHWAFMGVGFLLGALVFFFVGLNYGKPVSVNKNPFEKTQFTVNGIVTVAGGNLLRVEVGGLTPDTPAVPYLISTDGRTVFKKAVFKGGTSGRSLDLFGARPSSVEDALLEDVKVGDNVAVESVSNFWGLKELTASKIEIRIYQ